MTPLDLGIYLIALLLLVAAAVIVMLQAPASSLRRHFVWTDGSLVLWLLSVLFYDLSPAGAQLLVAGRLNFAATIWVVYAAARFVQVLRDDPVTTPNPWWLVAETVVLSGVTALTNLVDQSESLSGSVHSTVYGMLFTLFVLHIIGYLVLIAWLVLRQPAAPSRWLRGQLQVVGLGILTTGVVAVTTNIIVPVFLHTSVLDSVGPLASLLFLAATGYAVIASRLFDVRLAVKGTVVFAVLLAVVLAAYTGIALLVSDVVPQHGFDRDAATLAAILVIAVGFDPLRRWLEARTDRLLFQQEYRSRTILTDLALDLSDAQTLDDVLARAIFCIKASLRPTHSALVLLATESPPTYTVRKIRQSGGHATSALLALTAGPLPQLLNQTRSIVTDSTVVDGPDVALLQRDYTNARIVAAAPIIVDDTLAGMLVIGEAASGRAYASNHLQLLHDITVQVATALQRIEVLTGGQETTEFVHIAVHELRTPLAAALGYMSMVLDEHLGEVDKKARNYLGKSYLSMQRLSQLTNDVLAVSRLEAGKIVLQPRPTDLNLLIVVALDQLMPLAREKHLDLRYAPPTVPVAGAMVDPGRTTEVLINLLGNAIKYTPAGSVSVTLTAPGDHQVHIAIQDTGLGMDMDAQTHLFEKFYRVSSDETRAITGTGLGLYITKSLVEQMGGTISVSSFKGVGSTFTVAFPIAA
jgi:signal transduction histidine kinase